MPDGRPLKKLRNLGPKSVEWLIDAGISSEPELKSVGPVVAFQIVSRQRNGVSRNLLWALYGAIHDIDWRDIPVATKDALLDQVDQ